MLCLREAVPVVVQNDHRLPSSNPLGWELQGAPGDLVFLPFKVNTSVWAEYDTGFQPSLCFLIRYT
jgi:hypothetical protein